MVILERIGIIRILDIFEVRFIDDQQNVGRNLGEKPLPFRAPENRSRRIIRIGQKHQPGLRRNRRRHGIEIVGVIAQRHLLALAAHRLDDQLINHEGLLGHHRFIAGAHESSRRQLDDLVGAVAEDQRLGGDSKFFCQTCFQVEAIAVGIKMELIELGTKRSDGFRRWPQGIFIGGELHRMGDAVLAFHFFDGLARLVGDQRADIFGHLF